MSSGIIPRPRITPGLEAALHVALGSVDYEMVQILNDLLSPDYGPICAIDSPIVAFTNVVNIAATGTNKNTAAPLTGFTNVITGADGTKGVQLPDAVILGQRVVVINTSTTGTLKVWNSPSGSIINGGPPGQPATVAPLKGAIYDCLVLNPDQWWSVSN
jgi:hypothetical protein